MMHSQKRKKLHKEENRHICSVPTHLTRSTSTNRGLSNDQSISTCSQRSPNDSSSVSHLTPCFGCTGCATGFSTEHSSMYSWRYDELDRENTQHVRQFLSALDELLYEGKVSSKSETLNKEWKEWNMHSPHLRVLGNQLDHPKQEAFEYVHRSPTSVKMAVSPPYQKTSGIHELCVEGHKLTTVPCSDKFIFSRAHLSKLSLSCMSQEEEIYEAEGKIEEFLAYDEGEMEFETMGQRWFPTTASKDGVLAVSPNTCIHETIADELFDDVWRKVVGLLKELLHKHWKKLHSDVAFQRWTLKSSSPTLCDLSSRLPLRGNHISHRKCFQNRTMFLWPNIKNPQDSNVFETNLNGVMTVQAKPLQQRQQAQGESSDRDGVDSTLSCFKAQRWMRALSHKPSSHRIPRFNGRAQLCHSFPAQSTLLENKFRPSVAEDLLPLPVSRVQSHRLPLIHLESAEQQCSASAPRHIQSETQTKSYFTPMDFAFSMRKGKSFLASNFSRTGDGTPMGVTGFSLGLVSSTAYDSPEYVTSKRRTHFPTSTDGEPKLGSIGARRILSHYMSNGHRRKKLQLALSQHS